jgi:hypothetical protein
MGSIFGGGGGSQTSNKWEPWAPASQPLQDYMKSAQDLYNNKLSPYAGQTVADFSPQLGGAIQQMNGFALQGSPERAAGGAAILNATQGNMNPYATAMNPYMGDNPYTQNMVKNSNDLISQNFAKGTQAQTDAAAAQSKAYGGSAYNERTNDNARTLGGLLSANTDNLLSQQFNNSQNLAENQLNRSTSAYDASQNRALQGAQVGIGQQGADLQALQANIQAAGIPMQYQQQLLNAAQNYFNQGQQLPYTQLDALGNALSRATGGFGQGTQIGPGQNVGMGLLGLGMAGYGAYQGMGG